MKSPVNGKEEGSRAKGATQPVCGSVSPARVQGEEAGGTYPLPGCLGAGTLYANHREGRSWRKSQQGVLGQVTRGDPFLYPECRPSGLLSHLPYRSLGAPPQHRRLLSVAFCYTHMEAFGSWRLHPRKRRMPREVGGASRGKRKQTLEVIARTSHPPGAEASAWAGPE